ncbi:MAG: hypothetical protein ABIJ96_14190 [Elusimicrobiota bacterium]
MKPEDLQSELDELWKRVSSGPVPMALGAGALPPVPISGGDISSMTRDASLEAVSYLRRQHDAELLRLRQFSELKDRTVRELTDRLRAAEQEISSLRAKSMRGDAAIVQHMEGAAAELADAKKMLQIQDERFAEEEKILRGVAESTRQQLAAETARWRELERQWNEREQQYLLDIRELQARAERSTEEAAAQEGRSRHALNDLREAKNAIERTLAELLQERKEREQSNGERDKALGRVREIEDHMKGLQQLWDEERSQWQELWDRERSTWDSQRKEYAKWEGTLRSERKEWHETLSSLRERESKFHETMAESLRKSSAVGEKITSMLQFAASKAVDVISSKPGASGAAVVPGMAATRVAPPRPMSWKKMLSAAVVVAVLLSAYPLWQHAHRLRFELVESHVLPADNPTGMAYDGNVLMLSDWSGTIYSLDPEEPSDIISQQRVKESGVYHPNAAAIWGDALYTLDAAQSRILRHPLTSPAKIALSWPAPGPAPVTLTHDGQNLWSYDAATRVVYRHLGEGKDSEVEPYKLELDILPSAITWFKDELWVYDAKSRHIMLFEVDGKNLDLLRSKELATPLQSILLTYRADKEGKQHLELWGLHAPTEGAEPPALKKYRIKR